MKTRTLIKIFICFILTFVVGEIGLYFINQSDSLLNILGAIINFAYIVIIIKTKCFTQFKKNKQNEKEF